LIIFRFSFEWLAIFLVLSTCFYPASQVSNDQQCPLYTKTSHMFEQIHNSKNLPILLFLAILAIGFFLRVSTTRWDPLITFPDSTLYFSLAKEIQTSTYFQSDYDLDAGFLTSRRLPPFYPMLIAAFSFLPFEIERIGIWVSLSMSMLTFIPLYLVGRHLYSQTSGLIAIALFSFHPFALQWASPALTESTFTFLLFSTIAAGLWAINTKRPFLFILTGICAALSYLTREIGIVAICLVFIWSTFVLLRENSTYRRSIMLVALMLCTFMLTVMPHLMAIKLRTGEWGLTYQANNAKIVTAIFHEGGDQYDRFKLPGAETNVTTIQSQSPLEKLSFISSKLATNGWSYFKAFLEGVGYSSLGWLSLALIFVVYQIHIGSWRDYWKELYLLSWIISIIILYALVSAYMVDHRYMFPILLPALILCGQGICQSWDWAKKIFDGKIKSKTLSKTIASPIIVPLMMVGIIFSQEWPTIQKINLLSAKPSLIFSAGQLEVAKYLQDRQLAFPGVKVISYKPYMAYYLKGKAISLPKTYEELRQKIDNHEGDLLLADSTELAIARPLLFDLAFGGIVLPQPGPVIYSRLFPKFKRVITIYDLRQHKKLPKTLPEQTESTEERLKKAENFYQNGYLYNAAKECSIILDQDRNNHDAIKMIAQIYVDYCLKTDSPELLPIAIKICKKYLDTVPDDQQMKQLYADLCELRDKNKN